jgi:pseudouridine-5'-phosphate glycosidase
MVSRLILAHWELGGAGVVVAQPVVEAVALTHEEIDTALREAERLAVAAGIRGPAVTPFLLARLAEITGGKTLQANRELIVANARLAAELAASLTASRA